MGLFRLLGEAISGLVRVAIGPNMALSMKALEKACDDGISSACKDLKKKKKELAKKEAAKDAKAMEAKAKESEELEEGIIPKRLFTEQAFLMDHLTTYASNPPHGSATRFASRLGVSELTTGKFTSNMYINNYFALGPKELAIMKPFVRIKKGGAVLPLTLLGNNHKIEKAIGAPLYAAAKKKRIPQIALKSMTGQVINKNMAFTKVKFTLEIFCSDMDTFKANRGGWALIDLIRRKPKAGEIINPELASLSQQTVDIEFGWFLPKKLTKPPGSTIVPPDFTKIKDYVSPGTSNHQSASYKVSILKHDITFNKDGSFNITMEFNGTYNSALRSPTANVLFDPKGEYYTHLKGLKDQADTERVKAGVTKGEDAAQAAGRRDRALQIYEQERREVAPLVYNEFWKSIRQQEQFHIVLVPRETYNSWTAGNILSNPPPVVKANKELQSGPPKGDPPADNAKHKEKPSEETVEDVRKITYFPLGALLNVLAANSVGKLLLDKDTAQIFKHGFYVQFGSIAFFHQPLGVGASSQVSIPAKALPKVLLVSIASLPISLELFRAWMVKFFIAGRRLEMTLDEVLKEMITSLILASADQTAAISLTPYRQKIQAIPIQEGDTMVGLYYEAASEVEALSQQWMVGNEKADQNRGIYHFKPLHAQAVVRDFGFNRVDMKGATEMMSKGSVLSQTGIPRSKYNISLTLWGNAHFKIGQRIFVDPSALVGKVDSLDNQQLGMGGYYGIISVTHRISSNGFFTDIVARWEKFGKGGALTPVPTINKTLMAKKQIQTYAPAKSTVPDKNSGKKKQTKAKFNRKNATMAEKQAMAGLRACAADPSGAACIRSKTAASKRMDPRNQRIRAPAPAKPIVVPDDYVADPADKSRIDEYHANK